MGWTNGVYTRGYPSWAADAASNLPISSTKFDTEDNDFAAGLNNCLTKDGLNTPSAAMTWGLTSAQVLALTRGSDGAVFSVARTGGTNNPGITLTVTDAQGGSINTSGTGNLELGAGGFVNGVAWGTANEQQLGLFTSGGSTTAETLGYPALLIGAGTNQSAGLVMVSGLTNSLYTAPVSCALSSSSAGFQIYNEFTDSDCVINCATGGVFRLKQLGNDVFLTNGDSINVKFMGAHSMFGAAPTFSQSTGWGTPTGAAVENNYSGSAATLAQTSAAVAKIISMLQSFGLLGA